MMGSEICARIKDKYGLHSGVSPAKLYTKLQEWGLMARRVASGTLSANYPTHIGEQHGITLMYDPGNKYQRPDFPEAIAAAIVMKWGDFNYPLPRTIYEEDELELSLLTKGDGTCHACGMPDKECACATACSGCGQSDLDCTCIKIEDEGGGKIPRPAGWDD
jgi:hypothetical protein